MSVVVGDIFDEGERCPEMQEGRYWSSAGGDDTYPEVKNPIGFMRRKLRVRVKAWTMPIIKQD